jgi:hypothetical protein
MDISERDMQWAKERENGTKKWRGAKCKNKVDRWDFS